MTVNAKPIFFRHFCAIALALSGLLLACSSRAGSQLKSNGDETLPSTLATVNGREIPTKLYVMYLKNGREALKLDTNSDEGRLKLEQLREGIVSELIDRALVTQEAERRGLTIPSEKISEGEQRAITDLGGEKQYDSYLAEHGLTRDESREIIKQPIYGEMLRKELSLGLVVSPEDVKSYYEVHQKDANFQRPDHVTAAHIMIAARSNLITQEIERDQKLSGEALAGAVRKEMDRRRARAEELRRKAASGSDFAKLARESSEDPGTRDRGGDLGSFPRNSHSAAFDQAAFALQPGAVSQVVQTEYGFHVIKVSSRQPSHTLTLEEAKSEIHRWLLAEREVKKLSEWLKDARKKASIRISDQFRFGQLKDEFPTL